MKGARVRMTRIGLAGLLGSGIVGCGHGSGVGKADAGSELHAAAEAISNARSFRMVARHANDPPTIVDYQAPDRVRSSSMDQTKFGAQIITVIVIGGTSYQSDSGHPGKFQTFPTRSAITIHVFIDPVLNAQAVSRTGDTYRFTTIENNKPAAEEAHVQGGLLKDITTPYFSDDTPDGTQTFTFSDINQAPPVEPPPAAAIEPQTEPIGPNPVPPATGAGPTISVGSQPPKTSP